MAYYVDEPFSDYLAENLVELWGQIEADLIEEIARRITQTGITATGEYQARLLAQSNLLNKRAVAIISSKTGIHKSLVEKIITETGLTVVDRDEEIYRQALKTGQITVEPLPVNQSPTLKTAIDSCVENAEFSLSNLTNTRMMNAGNGMETLTKAARREYYNAANRAFLEVRTGAKTTPQATKQACMQLAAKGIQITHWESGHRDTIEVAVRRNIRTAIAQTSGRMTLARMEDYQSDLVEVSSHIGARPSHAVWQGGIYSLTGGNGYENFYEATGYGEMLGLCGINCRHRFFPYFPGTTPTFEVYDEEENRIAYEKTQEQRYLERSIRAAKRDLAAAKGYGDDELIKQAGAGVRAAQKDMRDWLSDNPEMRRMYDREQIYT